MSPRVLPGADYVFMPPCATPTPSQRYLATRRSRRHAAAIFASAALLDIFLFRTTPVYFPLEVSSYRFFRYQFSFVFSADRSCPRRHVTPPFSRHVLPIDSSSHH